MAKLPLILLAAPALLTVAFAGTSAAAAQDDQQRIVVPYDDLNLASAGGRARLTTRVKMAVRTVCNVRMAQGLREQSKARSCVAATMARADVQLADLINGNGARFASRGTVIVAAP